MSVLLKSVALQVATSDVKHAKVHASFTGTRPLFISCY